MNKPAEKFDYDGQWAWWLAALDGDVQPTPQSAAMSGFYRTRHGDGVAVWRDEEGRLFCQTTGRFQPHTAEAIDQLITGDGCRPIPHEVYAAKLETGRWPDDIEPPKRGIGDNSGALAPHEAIMAEIKDYEEGFRTWLKSIGGKIASEEHDAKAANYAKAVADLKAKAEKTHKTEKEPWLEGGRKVDAAWKPTIALADEVKRAMLAPTAEYRKQRDLYERQKREAELERLRAEQKKLEQEGAHAAPISMPPKKPAGLRTEKKVVITDLSAFVAQLLSAKEGPPPDLVETCQKIARRMLMAGSQVKGAEFQEIKVPT